MLNPLNQVNENFITAFKQFKLWAALSIALLICSFGVIVYELMLLEGSGFLAIPWFICSQLATIPMLCARRQLRQYHQDLVVSIRDRHDEYYKLVTGEDR